MSVEKSLSAIQSLTEEKELPRKAMSASKTLPTFSTRQLFGAEKEIGIEHEDLLYRLRITKQGKLILNK